MSAAALKERKPDQAEMLDQLAQAVDLDQHGPEAQKIHAQLKASLWTAEDREEGRKLGQDTVALKASENRILLRKEAIRLIVDGYYSAVHLSRKSLLGGLESYCEAYDIMGLNDEPMKISTIRRWLTREREDSIRLEATAQLRSETPRVATPRQPLG
jgi:hypothetical protein